MNSSYIRKAVIPVAGTGSRLRPLTNKLPKEMLATTKGPIIQLIVEELINSGIEHIIFVTSQNKKIIEDHLRSIELPKLPNGMDVSLEFIKQGEVPGNGGAITSALPYTNNEPFLVVWGDEVFLNGGRLRAEELIDAYNTHRMPIIALTKVSDDNVSRCGIVEIDKMNGDHTCIIKSLIEKPSSTETTSRLASVGGYILTPDLANKVFTTHESSDGEVYLSSTLSIYVKDNDLLGKVIEADWYETGSLDGYASAFIAIEKSRKEK
jgi:UTP--glucose-1-phosphate uridylyltransferase